MPTPSWGKASRSWPPLHDRDHVVLVDRDRRAIFTGDLVLPTVHPAIGPTRRGNPVQSY
jgi:glyoxylase-like metal-dependent hydrolase (beta-lactamase superfamily II)